MAAFFILVVGLLIGSFLNVVLWRLHTNQSFLLGRSRCRHCKKKIAWYDNIPVVSFLLLNGKCRHCKKKIAWQYPLVEIAAGCLTWFWFMQFGFSLNFVVSCVFSYFLLLIFVYDFLYYLIPDEVVLPAIVLTFLINWYQGFEVFDLLLGFLIGGGFFLLQFALSRGRWIGGGDIRLGALMGVMLGWKLLLVAFFLAYLSGAVIGLLLIATQKKKMSSAVPFGTFLSVATVVTLACGQALLDWYLQLLNF